MLSFYIDVNVDDVIDVDIDLKIGKKITFIFLNWNLIRGQRGQKATSKYVKWIKSLAPLKTYWVLPGKTSYHIPLLYGKHNHPNLPTLPKK